MFSGRKGGPLFFLPRISCHYGGVRRNTYPIFYGVGIYRSFFGGICRGKCLALQLGVGIGRPDSPGARSCRMLVVGGGRQYVGGNDLLLDRAFGKAGLDNPLFEGEPGETG